jgi:hypothetical protein
VKAALLCAGAAILAAATQPDDAEARSRRFAALVTAINAGDAPGVAALSRENDIMLMRGYAIIPAQDLIERLRGCTIASTRAPTIEGTSGTIRFSCPGRAARMALGPCDSGDLILGAIAKQGRLQLSLDELGTGQGACLPAPPAPPPPPTRPRSTAGNHG